jgi:CDP-diacylglycerol--glycerol-3-phosphate 3-phosphatidyltransferase
MFFILTDFFTYSKLFGLIIYVVASITDSIDGHIARKHNLVTDFGKFMDPLADKLLVISSLVCFIEIGVLNSWVVMIIIARELSITGFRTLAANKGITLAANNWGKLKTICQMTTIILILAINAKILLFLEILVLPLVVLTVVLTLLSGYIYIIQNKTVLK